MKLLKVCLKLIFFLYYKFFHLGIEIEPDHCYSRPWIDDPTIATALPRVQLFFNSNLMYDWLFFFIFEFILILFRNDLHIDIDDNQKTNDENLEKINWAPTINTIIPERFECPQESDEKLSSEQEIFIRDIRELIDETRIAALCCELVLLNIFKTINFYFLFLEFL